LECKQCGAKIGRRELYYERWERERSWRRYFFLWRVLQFDTLMCLRRFANDPTIGA
jgi:hypothetical protein